MPFAHPHAEVVLPLVPRSSALSSGSSGPSRSAAPVRVLEVGCGPAGGFVPALLARGDDAVGVDPVAPDGPAYHCVPVEELTDPGPLDAVVACVALHHVADLDPVFDRLAAWLRPAGTIVVLEWAWERFDARAAGWCFDRLPDADPASEPGPEAEAEGEPEAEPETWLGRRRDGWAASGLTWDAYVEGWAAAERIHTGRSIVAALDARFTRDHLADVPYFFTDLPGTTAADEQAAMDAGRLPASAFVYRGHLA